jgi:hypothetical protein
MWELLAISLPGDPGILLVEGIAQVADLVIGQRGAAFPHHVEVADLPCCNALPRDMGPIAAAAGHLGITLECARVVHAHDEVYRAFCKGLVKLLFVVRLGSPGAVALRKLKVVHVGAADDEELGLDIGRGWRLLGASAWFRAACRGRDGLMAGGALLATGPGLQDIVIL